MAEPTIQRTGRGHDVTSDPAWMRYALIATGLGFIGLLIIVPVANVLYEAFRHGWGDYRDAILDDDTKSALWLTVRVALVAVPLNAIFGLSAAWAITKFDFRGKSLL